MSRLLAIILVAIIGSLTSARAQNFMQHIRKTEAGKGTVTVTQSEEIDRLVNGKVQTPAADARKPGDKPVAAHGDKPHKDAPHSPSVNHNENEEETPAVDMSKKVMRNGYKINGYRVQAYAGGNTRQDRIAAERVRNAIKMKFPNQPVYVHFYSPRWICRVGNYRNYEEAAWMLGQLKKMGYKSATIVKGKITVQY